MGWKTVTNFPDFGDKARSEKTPVKDGKEKLSLSSREFLFMSVDKRSFTEITQTWSFLDWDWNFETTNNNLEFICSLIDFGLQWIFSIGKRI